MRKWGIKYAVVVINYFTKWTEAESLAITSKKVLEFVFKNIICRYGLPKKIVSDNGTQFDNDIFTKLCERHGITKSLSSIAHPQENGQVEAVNKTLKTQSEKCSNKLKVHGQKNYLRCFGCIEQDIKQQLAISHFS
ncbi:uncharacterized protein LOC133814738 [Humulus lupulus]|uniref:uncharacterized protein LOC133814738 n=1 Tax=Humulus lupulus TaxID=3486 RepID=UPI002B4028B8|nr:uncharacterized protein LOC133814738 [Humulus lupulus]